MRSRDEDTPLTDHLLDHFAGWYVICLLAVQSLEKARETRASAKAAKSATGKN
ncbi:MAG: hypothetical protein VXA66_05635 [Alphaproteobacteria bacterium]|jgi:hypothetical protein